MTTDHEHPVESETDVCIDNEEPLLFENNPVLRWLLIPIPLATAVLPFGLWLADPTQTRTVAAVIVLCALFVFCMLLCLLLASPRRFWWTTRVLAAMVFVIYAAYLVYEFGFEDKPFKILERQSAASPRNALLGFIVIGIPSLYYAVSGYRSPSGRRS